jgi:hypothetical protein
VKKAHFFPLEQVKVISEIEFTQDILNQNLGRELAVKIYKSEEYQKLYDVNNLLYKLVDKVKSDPSVGTEIDAGVYERHLAKKALQKKFFNEEFREVKTGY